MKKYFFLFAFLFFAETIFAQQFKYSCSVAAVDSNGFYRILLPPKINQYSENNFADIRLFDEEQREVPYLYKQELPSQKKLEFIPFEIVQRQMESNKSLWIVRNDYLRKLDKIELVISNASVTKIYKISGSKNLKKWFVVKDESVLNLPVSDNNISDTVGFDFPPTDYEFYRFEFNDKKSQPLNILAAGLSKWIPDSGMYSQASKIKIMQTDSLDSKTTWLTCSFDSYQYVDFFSIKVSKPKYYRRDAELFSIINKPKKRFNLVATDEVSSEQEICFLLPSSSYIKNFAFAIANDDNAVLKTDRVKAFQWNRALTVYLEKDKKYTLFIGNDTLPVPVYDIGFFTDKIPSVIPVVQLSNPVKIPHVQNRESVSKTFFTSKVFVWIAIGIVIALLAFITLKMLREMK